MAERVGFEPTVGCPITSFQDWLLKPLGHLSVCAKSYHFILEKSRFFLLTNATPCAKIPKSATEYLLFGVIPKRPKGLPC